LALPLLAALTPDDIEKEIIDENIRPINFDEKVDLVAMTVMIHLVLRALEIAHEFRNRGMKVIVGGIYPSLHPEKFEQYVDSIGIGEGEAVWPAIIEDLRKGVLKRQYRAGRLIDMKEVPFIRLRRKPRALPVDECVSGVCASPEPRYHCFGGFRHWRITLRSLGVGGYSCGGTTGLARGAP
jgi:radical SAM superfamily enzyme YgiQ (UPF0313 family)